MMARGGVVVGVVACVAFGGGPSAAQEARPRETLYGHARGARIAFFSPNGKFLVTHDSKTLLWDLATGKSTEVSKYPDEPLMFSPDSKSLILSSDPKRHLKVYDVAGGKSVSFKTDAPNPFLATSPDGKVQVVWDARKKSLLMRALAAPFDVKTAREPVTLTGATPRPIGIHPHLGFSPDGKTLAIKDQANRNVMLWDVESGKSRTLADTAGSWFRFSPDGNTLLVECGTQATKSITKSVNDRSVKLYDVASAKSTATLDIDTLDATAFSPDSKLVAAASMTGFRVWDAKNGRLVSRLARSDRPSRLSIQFTPDGKTLAATYSSGKTKTYQFWDVATGKPIASLPREVEAFAISPDGATFVTPGEDGRIRLWDMPGRKPADGKK